MSDTADPVLIGIVLMDDGKWTWDVEYDDEHSGLTQSGKTRTLDEALACVRDAIENGRTEP
jgi:hypothetical protein